MIGFFAVTEVQIVACEIKMHWKTELCRFLKMFQLKVTTEGFKGTGF